MRPPDVCEAATRRQDDSAGRSYLGPPAGDSNRRSGCCTPSALTPIAGQRRGIRRHAAITARPALPALPCGPLRSWAWVTRRPCASLAGHRIRPAGPFSGERALVEGAPPPANAPAAPRNARSDCSVRSPARPSSNTGRQPRGRCIPKREPRPTCCNGASGVPARLLERRNAPHAGNGARAPFGRPRLQGYRQDSRSAGSMIRSKRKRIRLPSALCACRIGDR